MRRFCLLVGALIAAAYAPADAAAQGTLSSQGFGYPPGQLSVQARSMGGATAELDPLSPINPAALRILGAGGLYFQSEQERRSVEVAGRSDRSNNFRFPLFAAAVPVGSRGTFGVSFSTFLDRTWGTEVRGEAQLGGDVVPYVERFESKGAMNDVRVAGAWAIRDAFVVGLAVHAFPGENRLAIARIFDDTLSFAPLRDSSQVSYSGVGASAGLMWRPARSLTLAGSARLGGELKVREADTLRSTADVPSRIGVGARYDGFRGAVVALRADRTLWSDLDGLGSERVRPEDAWDFGLGVEVAGPRVATAQLSLRAGARRRTLPFRAADDNVRETAFSLGAGAPLARGRGTLDLFVERASRSTSGLDASERAWTFGLGLTVRP